jgi:YegS/Rv2252/BmrU family lipid kinase
MSSNIPVIINPASGSTSGKRIARALQVLEAGGLHIMQRVTQARGQAEAFARAEAEKGAPFVIAAGGDGTFNEVINGLVGTGVPLGILPIGTTNILALELGIPLSGRKAARRILEGKPREVSVGKVVLEGTTRYFCLMAGIGFDADVVSALQRGSINRLGKLAYIIEGFRLVASWNPQTLTVRTAGEEYTCHSLIASNVRKYAGKFTIAPRAGIADEYLHLVMLLGRRRGRLLRFAWGILTGTHLRQQGVKHVTARELDVAGSANIQIDGDYLGTGPAHISILPRALRLIS